jgi:hypothetical protein
VTSARLGTQCPIRLGLRAIHHQFSLGLQSLGLAESRCRQLAPDNHKPAASPSIRLVATPIQRTDYCLPF